MSVNTCPSLERIDDGISIELRDEIRTLVDAKYLVDKLARETTAGSRLTTAFHDGGYGPRYGTEFFRTVLPFSQMDSRGESFSALVPTAQTIGASWRWTTRSVPEDERLSLLARLQDSSCAASDSADGAYFVWIKPLGLFLAHEGKNRVGFFRDMRAAWIPAHVSPCDYPAPERLTVYEVKHANDTLHWAVLDGKSLEPLAHPEWSLPILRAYGVKHCSQWPTDFPSIELTAAALSSRIVNPISSRPRPLDLCLVLEKEAFENEEVTCALVDIKSFKPPWLFLLAAAIVGFDATLLLAALPPEWGNVRIATGIVMGVGCGVMLPFVLNIFRLPRRIVDPFAVYSKFSRREREAAGVR